MTDPFTTGPEFRRISVVMPARNEGTGIERVLAAIHAQEAEVAEVEVLVVDDGSEDDTVECARAAGARVVPNPPHRRGSPGAARNLGARISTGDPIVFLDADCEPEQGWLSALLEAHRNGAQVVGGSLSLPPGLSLVARCDYYCGWYLVHPARAAGEVPHHPPPNLSVRRAPFFRTQGFLEDLPHGYTNEERDWQGKLRAEGCTIRFEPRAVARHYNRPGLGALLRRNFRWAHTAIEVKRRSGAARAAWLYRRPRLLMAAAPLLIPVHSAFIVACWLRARVLEPVLLLPLVLLSRVPYATGMVLGGLRSRPPASEG